MYLDLIFSNESPWVILVLMRRITILYTCHKTCTKYQNAWKKRYPRIITSLITSSSHSSDESIVLHNHVFIYFHFRFLVIRSRSKKLKIFLREVSSFLFYSVTGPSSFWLIHVAVPPLHICILLIPLTSLFTGTV